MEHGHDHADHADRGGQAHGHGHGHENDQGWRGMVRYLSHARDMWRSEINEAVIAIAAPARGETVLDIGAGVGAGATVAARTGAHVIALEPTPYMRRILGVRARLGRHRSIDVRAGSAEATGLGSGSVDAAWAVNTMHHWVDLDRAVLELARVLRSGGRLLLVDEDFDDPTHPDHDSFTDRHGDHDHGFHMVDADAVAAGLSAAGLDVVAAGDRNISGRPTITIEATKPA